MRWPCTNSELQPPELGVEEGGLFSAEALMLARYFMYSQLYFHSVRRIYNIHLIDFFRAWLPNGKFNTNVEKHLRLTDNEVMSAILTAARDKADRAHDPARRIACRDHFRLVYERNPDDTRLNTAPGAAVFTALRKSFDSTLIRHDVKLPSGGAPDFPVRMHDDRIASSMAVSETLSKVPVPTVDFIFADKSIATQVREFIQQKRADILKIKEE